MASLPLWMLVIGLVKHVGHLSGRDFKQQTGRHGSGGGTIDYVLYLRVCPFCRNILTVVFELPLVRLVWSMIMSPLLFFFFFFFFFGRGGHACQSRVPLCIIVDYKWSLLSSQEKMSSSILLTALFALPLAVGECNDIVLTPLWIWLPLVFIIIHNNGFND